MSRPRLRNPFYDSSPTTLWSLEKDILRRLAAGDLLIEGRLYVEDGDHYVVYWYWDLDHSPWGEDAADGAVSLLLGRQAIRPVRCGGGYTVMVLTPAGARKAKSLVKGKKR